MDAPLTINSGHCSAFSWGYFSVKMSVIPEFATLNKKLNPNNHILND